MQYHIEILKHISCSSADYLSLKILKITLLKSCNQGLIYNKHCGNLPPHVSLYLFLRNSTFLEWTFHLQCSLNYFNCLSADYLPQRVVKKGNFERSHTLGWLTASFLLWPFLGKNLQFWNGMSLRLLSFDTLEHFDWLSANSLSLKVFNKDYFMNSHTSTYLGTSSLFYLFHGKTKKMNGHSIIDAVVSQKMRAFQLVK